MEQFSQWTLDTIRSFDSSFSWIEDKRVDWITTIIPSLHKLVNGYSFIVLSDDKRKWFVDYLIQYVNKDNNRPLLPFYNAEAFTKNINLKTKDDIELFEDMLSISFNENYIFFYIGEGNHFNASIAKRKDDSLLWVMDENLHNSFYLESQDDLLDIRLLQLTKLLDKSIEAVLFGQVEL